ncbi:MAG TPA: glycosyltransferase [Candidatus Acidoferrum sp.]|nr:glycosyltransferase [Candidatus Acidoferrum sp.]
MNPQPHLLLYEPRVEGHHLGWLQFITEDLLSANRRLTLAVDLRPENKGRVRNQLSDLQASVTLINAYDASGRRHGDRKAGSVAYCLQQSGADRVFLCAFDEIASHIWRWSAVGVTPPKMLRGRMGGIYHRPRFLAAPRWSFDRCFKETGFWRLIRHGWLNQLLFVDEFLAAKLQAYHLSAPIYFLPDVCPTGYEGDGNAARQKLNVPAGKFVFLFYGGGYRRKGLHLAVQAMLDLPVDSPAFLFCAGQQDPTGETAQGLEKLAAQNRALLINRYVSAEEEKLCFAASDVVLLPYINHFGSSGVLSRAMAARKPVIVSDEQLLGKMTREHRLGLLFSSGDAKALSASMKQAIAFSPEEKAQLHEAARRYTRRYSREAFREVLVKSLQ